MNTEGEPSPEDMGLNPEDMKVPGLERADKPENQKPQKSEKKPGQGESSGRNLQDTTNEEKHSSSQKGFSIGDSLAEDDFTQREKEQEGDRRLEASRVEARMSAATLAVDTAVPGKNHEELVEIVKENLPTPEPETRETTEVVDAEDWVGLDQGEEAILTSPLYDEESEIRLQIEKLQEKDQEFRKGFAEKLAETQIPETDLSEYARHIYTAAKEVTESDKDVRYHLEFLRYAESADKAKLTSQFAHIWRERFLTTDSNEDIWNNRVHDFSVIIEHILPDNYSAGPLGLEETAELFDVVVEGYEIAYKLPETTEDQNISNHLTTWAIELGRKTHDPEQARNVLEIYKEIADDPDRKFVERAVDTARRYAQKHGLTEDSREGFINKLFPAMRSDDPQVEILNEGGNIWGMEPGDFGVADFLVHSYALRVTPENINELLMAARENPTTDLARMEQNRLDGLTLAKPFRMLKEFIHDQRPYMHEVIEAMVKYYDTGDNQQLLSILEKTDSRYFGLEENRKILFDKEKYDTPTVEKRADRNPDKEAVKPIDVLRRLKENTKPVKDESPVTSDAELNLLLQRLAENTNRETLQQTLDYANSKLLEMMQKGEVGIEPNHILAYALLDKKGFQILQSLKYEDQLGVYKQKWFHSILRFQELTASASKYNEDEFRHFVNKVIYSESPKAAYRLIVQRELDNVSKLASTYKAKGKRNWVEALWSGNSAHELIGLTDLRSASTVAGRKHREEAILRDSKPGYHSGD